MKRIKREFINPVFYFFQILSDYKFGTIKMIFKISHEKINTLFI